ncbi:MAG: helix-turn-helix domain-containing protein [Eggerthellaceae bacterium]|nr:helix-turn-helix domain-containing protein [Eggerthellaceae bacterium]
MSWLAKARNLNGVTAKELSKAVGLSLNYIQQIESGRRTMSAAALARVYQYLGYDERELPLDSMPLMEKLGELERRLGEEAFCLCRVNNSSRIGYITDVVEASESDLKNPPDSYEPIRIRYARNNLEAQMILFEKPYDD